MRSSEEQKIHSTQRTRRQKPENWFLASVFVLLRWQIDGFREDFLVLVLIVVLVLERIGPGAVSDPTL
jgi:hypothetical protein